ncbi:hypothetical protein DH2020_048848 [Rehmannia glutinosa]|uniref:Peptidase A2 domain-containing protein n=1 Tax=Rehmannia glutinosa TaxID=99300 RepID=A0ABR0U4S2_REHGL
MVANRVKQSMSYDQVSIEATIDKTAACRGASMATLPAKPAPSEGTIHMIVGGPQDGDSNRRGRRTPKFGRGAQYWGKREGPEISFGPKDEQVSVAHNDAMVITTTIANYEVARAMVDTGSSVNILFHEAYLRMEWKWRSSGRDRLFGFGEEWWSRSDSYLPMFLGDLPCKNPGWSLGEILSPRVKQAQTPSGRARLTISVPWGNSISGLNKLKPRVAELGSAPSQSLGEILSPRVKQAQTPEWPSSARTISGPLGKFYLRGLNKLKPLSGRARLTISVLWGKFYLRGLNKLKPRVAELTAPSRVPWGNSISEG